MQEIKPVFVNIHKVGQVHIMLLNTYAIAGMQAQVERGV